jgi:hypothetical protein
LSELNVKPKEEKTVNTTLTESLNKASVEKKEVV